MNGSEAKIRRKVVVAQQLFESKALHIALIATPLLVKQGCFHIIFVEIQQAHNAKLCLVGRNIECINNCGNTQCCTYAFTD